MKGATEENSESKTKYEKKEKSEGATAPKQIRFQEPRKDETLNIPSEESSEEESDVSSVDKRTQKTVEESSEEESESGSDIAKETKSETKNSDTSEKESSDDESGVSEDGSHSTKVVNVPIHQEIPKSLKPRPISKTRVKEETEESSEESSESQPVPYSTMQKRSALEKELDQRPSQQEYVHQEVHEETPIITTQPVIATAAFTSLFSAFSPLSSSGEHESKFDSQQAKASTSEDVKPTKKKIFYKVPNEDAVIVPLHGSSDEEGRTGKDGQEEVERNPPNKYDVTIPLHKSSYEQPVVDEGDGLIQTMHPSASNNSSNKSTLEEKMKKENHKLLVKVPTDSTLLVHKQGSFDDEKREDESKSTESNASEIHELQTIQRIYGTSDEVGLGDEEPIVTDQPAVATVAFTALFGAFSPLGEAQNGTEGNTKPNEQENVKNYDQKFTKKKRRIFKKVPNQNAVFVPLHSSSGEDNQFEEDPSDPSQIPEAPNEYAVFVPLNDENNGSEASNQPPLQEEMSVSHPTIASAAFTSLFTAVSPFGEKHSPKNGNEVNNQVEELEPLEQKPAKRKPRMFKKVPNENAVYVPLHSSEDDDPKDDDSQLEIAESGEGEQEAPNEYAIYVPLNDKATEVTIQQIPEDNFAAQSPTIASAAFTSLFSAFSPLGGHDSTNTCDEAVKDKAQEEDKMEAKPTKKKQRIFKKVPNENAVLVPLHSSSEEEEQNDSNEQPVKESIEYSEAPNEYAVYVPLQDDCIKAEDNVKEDIIKKTEEIVVNQPSVATAAFTALFSAFSPLGVHEPTNTENNGDNAKEQMEELQEEEKPRKKKQRMFKKVPNINAVYVPLHSSSEEDLPQEDVTEVTNELESSTNTQEEAIDEPNKYAVYVPLHDESNGVTKTKKNEEDIVIEQPSVATAAFSALFSVFSPLACHNTENNKQLEETSQQNEFEKEEKEIITRKKKNFKKIPNENAVYVPLHSSSDEEATEKNEGTSFLKNISEEVNEEPNKHAVFVPLKDEADESTANKNFAKEKTNEQAKKTDKENVIISQPSVATAAFTALYSASITPVDNKSETSIPTDQKEKNINVQTIEGEKEEDKTLNTENTEETKKVKKKIVKKKVVEGIKSTEKKTTEDVLEKKDDKIQSSNVEKVEKPTEAEVNTIGSTKIKEKIQVTTRTEEKEVLAKIEENKQLPTKAKEVEEEVLKKREESEGKASTKKYESAPVQTKSKEDTQILIGNISQTTVATAAFTSLFSAFSPLGEKEQVQEDEMGKPLEDIVPEENTEIQKTTKRKQRLFKKVPNENAVYVPLHSSDEDEKQQDGEENSEYLEIQNNTDAPNEYKIFVSLHEDESTKGNNETTSETRDISQINQTTIATAAFSSLFSAFSPLGGESEQTKKTQDPNATNNVEDETSFQKLPRGKPRMFKKVPNENAVYVPLHGTSDEEKSGEEETETEVLDASAEAPNEYAIFVPLGDSNYDANKEQNENKSPGDDILNKTTIATAAFTSLFTAFSPLGESEQAKTEEKNSTSKENIEQEVTNDAKKTIRRKPRMFKKVPNENAVYVPLHGTSDEEKSGEEETETEVLDASAEAPNEYAILVPLGDSNYDANKEQNKNKSPGDDILNKTTIATAAFTSLFTAFSPLGESEQAKTEEKNSTSKENAEQEVTNDAKKTIRRKPRMFKKVPNENAVYVPLHGTSDEEKSGEEDTETAEIDASAEAPNEYAIFVSLQEDFIDSGTGKDQIKKQDDIEEINKTTVATAAFTALFSAFSPLGSTEQIQKDFTNESPKQADEIQNSAAELKTKKKKVFKKVPNEDAIIIPLQGSFEEEEKPEVIELTSEQGKEEEQKIKEEKAIKSILKTSKSSEKVQIEDKMQGKSGIQALTSEKTVQIEEPHPSEETSKEKLGKKGKPKKTTELDTKTPPEGPIKVKAKQIDLPEKPQTAVKMADVVLDVLAKKDMGKTTTGGETEEQSSNKPLKEEEAVSCDHEYEPIQAPRAASQPDVRLHSLDAAVKKREEEEDRYEVVRPQEAPLLQETRPNLQTEGGYEVIEEPKKEQRQCIKIPDEDAIIVPLHGSSDEEINPDRYRNPALMMSEEEIESFPRQPLPFVNIPMQNSSNTQPTNEGPTFQEKLKTQADRFTTKLKGISKPNIVIHRPKMKFPERPNIKMPEMPKIKLPERAKFNFPDKSKFHLPDTSKFHLPEKPKFLTERPRFKLPERFTHHEKKPKAPRGKKPNPSSLRRPLRDVVTISSQSTPGSTHNIFETLKFRTYPRFFKKKKAPIQKMSSLETESSQPETPPRRPRRFSDQQQDTTWVHAYNRDIRFADEETNLRVERMEEEYEREENTAPFHENYELDTANVESEFQQAKAESMISVASEKGSSGSSSNRRRAGVIEEIDSDEFFLREKGLSREDVDVSRYLSLEIRDAFRQPKNALANLDNELYDEEERDLKFEHVPRAPKRIKPHKSASADRAKEFHTFPKRPSRRKESDPEIVVKPPRRFRSKSGSQTRYRSRQSSMPSLTADMDMGPAPTPPQRTSRERSIRSLNKEGRASDLDIVHTRITAQHSGEIPPIAPLRKSRSRGTSLADDDRTSRGADSGILPVDDEVLHHPHAEREIDEDIMIDDELQEDLEETRHERRHEPIQTQDSLEIEERYTEHSGYAVVTKKKPPRPPPPPHSHFDFQSQLDTIKTTGKNIFFTYPRRAIKSLHKPLPHAPMRNYNTLGPVRPPRRNRVFRKPVYMTGETPTQEAFIDKERDLQLQSGDVVSRMKVRPLPPPPRPPRGKSRDYDVLLGESSPSDTIVAASEFDLEKERIQEAKENRASYLKAKKAEILKTISKYTSFDSKKEEEEEESKVQTTTSQQTSFDYGEVSVSIQTDPLPKDVIVIDQEIEETEEILILSDVNGKESKEEKSETDSFLKTRSPKQEKKLKEDVERKEHAESLEDNIFQQALERVEAAKGVLKEARERVIPGSTTSLDDRRTLDERESLLSRFSQRESLPASSRSVGEEREGTPPPLPARPIYTKPIPVSFPDKLHLTELDVDKLNVSEIQANKIKVSEIESTCIDVTELTSRRGNLTLNGLELPPDFISNVVAQVTSQVQSQVSEQVQSLQAVQRELTTQTELAIQRELAIQKELAAQREAAASRRELTPQRQERRVVTPPPSIIVQASADPVALPEPRAPQTEVKEHIPQPKTTKSRGRKSPTRVIDDSEDELASIMPRRRELEKERKKKAEPSKADDPPLPSPNIEGTSGPTLGQASSLQLMGRLFSIWQGHVVDGAGSLVEGVNSFFPDGEKRRDAQIAAVILLILITGLILIGFGFDHSVHHHHWDYLPPR